MAGDNTEMIKLLHQNVQSVVNTLGDIREDIGGVKSSIDSIGRTVENHPKICPALLAFGKPVVGTPRGASIAPSLKISSLTTWSIRLAPLILTAALGLIGLGFYFASGNADDAKKVMVEIRALADRTTKLSGEVAQVKNEIVDGGVQK